MIHCKLKRLLFNLALILPGVINTLPVYSRLLSDPVASNVSNFLIQNISGRSQILPLIGTDADGTISSFKILSLPAASAGKLYLNNALVTVNQVLTPAQSRQLQFEVLTSFTGSASFTYTVTDNDGLTDSTPATFIIPVTSDGSLLVCTGGGLGPNILGASGTFSAPYITANATVNCINNNSTVASPAGNLGNAKPALTDYTYASTSNSLGPEGTYSFLKTLGTMATRNCIKTDWVASDHTGDGGYAMIVNGSPNQNSFGKTFYKATSMTVCPNTLYEFSAYVINVLPGNHSAAAAGSEPNISFYINGQLVSTSGAIPYSTAATGYVPQWVKVGGLWYSGPNTSVDLRIDNATFVAGGNDLGLDDISLAICGPDITYPNVSLTPKFCSYGVLPLNAEVKASINTYSSYIFQISTDGGSIWTDMGSPKTGSPVYDSGTNSYVYTATYGDIPIDPSMNGYRYRLKVATDAPNLTGTTCNVSADKIITVSAFSMPDGGLDIVSCNAITSAALSAAQSGETWSASLSNPAAAVINQSGQVSGLTVNGIYSFYLTNAAGCVDTVKITRSEVKTAGTDAVVCSDQMSYKFADAPPGYEWKIVSGNPSAASIDPNTGFVSNLGVNGDYQFELVSTIAPCSDIVRLTKGICPNISFRAAASSFHEEAGAVTVEVFLDQAAGFQTSVAYSLGTGTATNGSDYTVVTGSLNFGPGETSKLISVDLLDDNVIEPDETVVFNLSAPVNASLGAISQHTLTILNDDAEICISADMAAGNEGNPAALTGTDYTFRISRTPGSYTGNAINFTYKLVPASAGFDADDLLDGNDLNKELTGTIPAGQNSVIINYQIKRDLAEESDEPFKVLLVDADNGITISCVEAEGNVLNDDLEQIIIQFETLSTETPEGNISVLLKVILSKPSSKDIDIPFDLADITAVNGVDYSDIPQALRKVHFNQNDQEAFITIGIIEDINDETDETFQVMLHDPGDAAFILGLQTIHMITIADDDPLIVQDDHFSTNEDIPLSNTVKTNDYDPGGDPLTFILLTTTQHGQLIFNPNGNFTYTPDAGYSGADSYTYRACNINNLPSCGNATVYIDVIPVNDPPVAGNDSFRGQEDAVISQTVISNDSDPDGDVLAYTRLTNPARGSLVFNPDGSFIYTPAGGFNGTDSFTYRACDLSNACAVAEVTLTVSPVNDPPVAMNDTFTVGECNIFSGSVANNDSDPDNIAAELTYSLTGTYDTTKGTIAMNADGSFSFTPSGRFAGSVQVHYTVTDPGGLSADGVLTINQPNPLLLVTVGIKGDAKCFGDNSGFVNIVVTGGVTPYSYVWSNGVNSKNPGNLYAGTYDVVVTDANGCTSNASVTITQPAALSVSETHTNLKCFGAADGAINLTISGGTAPYTYAWSNGFTGEDPINLTAGTYSVLITDANGCTSNASVTVTQPLALSVSETYTNLKCFGAADGAISLTVFGGTAPYTYAWSNGFNGEDPLNLAAGNYTVVVTDANGCTSNASVTITQPAALSVTETHTNLKCFGAADGAINLTVSGGTAPYAYAWSNGFTNKDLLNLAAGTYTVLVTDANGCTANASITITQPLALSVSETHTNLKCFGAADGAINLTVSGGTAPYSYKWSNGATGASLAGLSSGNYKVTITDINGCTAVKDITILQPAVLAASVQANGTTCRNSPDGSITVTVSGGTAPYTFVWNGNTALRTQNLNAVAAGKYTVLITDANNCSVVLSTEVVPGNCGPRAADDKFITAEDNGIQGSVALNDSDPDNDKLIFTAQSNPAHGELIFNTDGSFNFKPDVNWNGTTTFYYSACDAGGLCSAAKVTLIVNPVNDPPLAVNDIYQTPIGSTLNVREGGVLGNDSDPEGDKLTAILQSGPQHGSLVLNKDGTFVYTAEKAFFGEDYFTYFANDGILSSNLARVTIQIPGNRASAIIATVNLTPARSQISEGESITITAELTTGLPDDVIIALSYGGTAIGNVEGTDYRLTGNYRQILIPAGQTKTTEKFNVEAIADDIKEGDEYIDAHIDAVSNPNAIIGSDANIIIKDVWPPVAVVRNEPPPNSDILPDPYLSPNGDGRGNEVFIISNISLYPDNEVLIFNRWGNEVFRTKGYTNDTNAFKGRANRGLMTNTSAELADGVYYFMIYSRPAPQELRLNKGYIILKR